MTSSNQSVAEIRILSLAEGRALLALYETMLEMACTRDWDRLVEIERQAATLRNAAIARPSPRPGTENVEELAALLARIQRLDHEVRSLVEPAHEQARQLLAVEVKGRVVREAYGDPETS